MGSVGVTSIKVQNSYLGRVSIRLTLPLISALLALAMALLFIAVSIIAVDLDSQTESRERTEQLSKVIAPYIAAGDLTEADRLIDTYTEHQVAVVSNSHALLAGTAFATKRDAFHTVLVVHDGAVLGELQAARLKPANLPIPVLGIALLTVMAMALAATSGGFFGGYVARGAQELTTLAKALRQGTVKLDEDTGTDNFVEFRRLRQSMLRAVGRVQREAKSLRNLAYVNPTSGLANGTALEEALERVLQTANFDHPMALIRLELDDFDSLCEGFGSDVGEALLRAAVKRVRAELKALDQDQGMDLKTTLLAQTSPDSLSILVPHVAGRQDASAIARALRSGFAAPVEAAGHTLSLSVSGGIVMGPEDGASTADLLRRAETAIRSVREDDKNGFRFYAPRLDRVAKGRVQLETEMRQGIQDGEFVPHFQPKIDFRTGRLRGCEALARWERPGGRSVSPGAFIPVAEETGYIEQIGESILRQACQAAAGWLRQGLALSLAVNVSPVQLGLPGFRDMVLSALTEAGLPPSYLELEITESMAIERPEEFREVLGPLQAMGVRLAVDDFGTGHSNLAILSSLNFDVFKIDRQFIKSLERDESARPIVEMILAMAESLGLETVAEGVETPGQARFLRARGCTQAQGFLYSRPLPENDFIAFATAWEQRRARRTSSRKA